MMTAINCISDRLAAKLARKDNLNVKLSQRPGKLAAFRIR